MLLNCSRLARCFTSIVVVVAGWHLVSALLIAADANAIGVSKEPLPGLISKPELLPGNRRWQMFGKAPSASIRAVDFRGDGKLLALAAGRAVRIYQVGETIEFQTILVGHTDLVRAVRFSPKHGLIATASLDGTVRLWNAEGRESFCYREHEGAVHDVAWNSDNTRLASAGADGTVRIWSTDGTTISTLSDHEAPVNAVAWHPDGTRLASGCENKVIRFWTADGEKGPVAEGHIGPIRSLAWNRDGSLLLSCDHGIEAVNEREFDLAHVKVWNDAGKEVNSLATDVPNSHVCWSPDGRQVLVGGSMRIRIWTPGERSQPIVRGVGQMGLNIPVAWNPANDLLIAGTQLFNSNGRSRGTLPVRAIQLSCVDVSPDGKMLAVGSARPSFYYYRADGEQIFASPDLQGRVQTNVFWRPDGQAVLPVVRATNRLQQYDLLGEKKGEQIVLPGMNVRAGEWSRDCKRFVAGGDALTIVLIDFEKKSVKPLGRQAHGITQVRFTADQKQVCSTGFDGCLRFWSLDGTPGAVFESIATSTRALGLTHDGKLYVTGNEDGTIRLWDYRGETVNLIGGHGGFVETLDFSPDNELFASGSWDQSIRIWKRDATAVSTLHGHDGSIYSVKWDHDGQRLYSCADDGGVRCWNVATGETEWQSLMGERGGYVTLDAKGNVKYGNEEVLESDFVFFVEDEAGNLVRSDWQTIHYGIAKRN